MEPEELLKLKQNKVRIEIGLLKERHESVNLIFNIKQSDVDFMVHTEQGCDILLSQFKALNQGLDKIWSPKEGNHKRDNDLI